MIRYVKPIFTLFIFFCFIVTPLKAMQDGQSTVIVSVEDDYTNEPVESVLVRLLDNGSEIASGTTDLTGRTELVLSVTSNEEPELIPESFEVSESYPNPFEQSSSVNLQIEEAQEVQAEIYNIIGQRVASLQVNLTPGTYTLQSSLGHLAQGVYFLRILGTQSQTIKMTKVGERIFSGGSILNINPATFVTRNGPGMARLTLNGQTSRSLTLVTSKGSYDTFQQSLQVAADTTIALEMSRNNEVIVRVADEGSPTQDVETDLLIEGDQLSQQITSPDTLSLKSGFYTLSADEDNTAAFSQDVEIASEDQTVTVLTQVKTLAENQLQLEGLITDESSGTPIDRAYIYLLNQTTSDTLSGPLFAGSDGVLDAIANLDGGPDLDLSILYRKAGYTDFEGTASVSLPDTLILNTTLQPAPAPTASFTVTGDQTAGSPVMFDASASVGASGEDLTFSWDFGNGKRGYGQMLSHVYASSGNYDVTLTVAGDFGSMDSATESVSVSSAPSPPALTIINGEITSVDLEPLEGVTANVVNDDFTSVSGTDGRIVLGDIPSGVPIVVQLTKPGYALQTVRITPDDQSEENYFSTSMIELETPVTVQNIENGTSVTGKYGTKVSLPIDGLVDSEGEVVTGDVDLTLTPLDVSSNEIFSFPGGFEGLRPDGEQGNLVSYGVADFTFTQNGETLQMMSGKSAEIEIPVTYADVEIGDIIPLWTLDEEIGLWIEEGTGEIIASGDSPSGLAMITTTGHFSWKNIDVYFGGTGFDGPGTYTLVPQCRNAETGLVISCTFRGTVYNDDDSIAGYSPTVVIPASGNFEYPVVPLNKRFEIEVFSGFGLLKGTASIPPVSDRNEIVNVIIELTSRVSSSGIPIAYGDFLKGKAFSSEITRYIFEGDQGDFIRVKLREGIGSQGNGNVYLRNSDEVILKQGRYANNFSQYLFEELSSTGTYFIDVEAETETSNFDIELDLFEGPINRSIKYGDRLSDFLWPGTTNTYTFSGQTEEIFELIARKVEGSLFANLKLTTPNENASYDIQFFDYNVWVKKLEEKDGVYTFEVSGVDQNRFGEYILDFNISESFRDSGTEIAYGDSIIGKVTKSLPNNTFTFEGSAGDYIRFHYDKPYPNESENEISIRTKIFGPDMSLLYEPDGFAFSSYSVNTNFGSAFILPADGLYNLTIETDDIESSDAEGELYSLVLKNFENPLIKDFDMESADFRNEVFDPGLNINVYEFSGENVEFGRIIYQENFGSNIFGYIQIYDQTGDLLIEKSTNGRSDSFIDVPLSDQQYTAVLYNLSRVTESESYKLNLNRGELIDFNTIKTEAFQSNETKALFYDSDITGTEVSVSLSGFGNSAPRVTTYDPENESINFFQSRMTNQPFVLEKPGTHMLTIRSVSNVSTTVDVTVVEIQPAESFQLLNNETITLNGSIRVNGDIDRFDFTPDVDGTVRFTLLPAEMNSIDDSGNLNIQPRYLLNNNPVRSSFEDDSPEGDELFIWEGEVEAMDDIRINILEQAVVTTGDFVLEVLFTPDP